MTITKFAIVSQEVREGPATAQALLQKLLECDLNKYVLAHDGSEGDQDAALLWAASLRQGHNPYSGIPGISGIPSTTAILQSASLLQHVDDADLDGPPASKATTADVLAQMLLQPLLLLLLRLQQQTQTKPATAALHDGQPRCSGGASPQSRRESALQHIPAEDDPTAATRSGSKPKASRDDSLKHGSQALRHSMMPQSSAMATAAAAAVQDSQQPATGQNSPAPGPQLIRHQTKLQVAAEHQHQNQSSRSNTLRPQKQPQIAREACHSLQGTSKSDRQASVAAVPGGHASIFVNRAGLPSVPSADSQAPSTRTKSSQLQNGSGPPSIACPGLHKQMTPPQQRHKSLVAVTPDVDPAVSEIGLEPPGGCQQQALTLPGQLGHVRSGPPTTAGQDDELVRSCFCRSHHAVFRVSPSSCSMTRHAQSPVSVLRS